MVLVDYKGGAAFAPFAGLPHVAGMINNLADDARLIERAHASLAGEVVRRQQLLEDAGNVAGDRPLPARCGRQRPDLPPMPHLFVVIDEFGELLTAEPEFVDLFLSIGRIGRSIGVHLLLSSQRIEGASCAAWTPTCRTGSVCGPSRRRRARTVLDTPDAFHLPALPGYGYLKVDTSVYRRFRVGLRVRSRRYAVDGAAARRTCELDGPFLLPTYNTVAAAGTGEEAEAAAAGALGRPPPGRRCVDRLLPSRTPVRRTAPSRPSGCRRCPTGWRWPGSSPTS